MAAARTFRHTFVVPASDMDELGHANNTAYVRWVQEVAVAHSSAVGLDFSAYQRMGSVFVLRRHEIDYLRSVRAGDAISANTRIVDAAGVSCTREMVFEMEGAGVIAKSLTTWVMVDFVRSRPTRIPDAVRDAFEMPRRGGLFA
ncbi:MAG: acyl-CoA thioesterase [Polyangiaceae bacterium]|nr:acyl-CoA thioesterase [Polyangiaceae bacterium]